MQSEVKVSVLCLTYNHEKYIRQCLDGFVMQKTNFKYEVLIHDDASTDGTAEIIREYEKKYPDIIKPIYQVENQYSKGIKISQHYLYPRIQGKYTAWCEGDDFWIDENKLQMQFDAMEKHEECELCVHKVDAISADAEEHQFYCPSFDVKPLLSQKEFLHLHLKRRRVFFQTSSHFATTSSLLEYAESAPDFSKAIPRVGDFPKLLWWSSRGGVVYIDKVMSKYRNGVPQSWTVRISEDKIAYLNNLVRQIDLWNKYSEYTLGKYEQQIEKCTFALKAQVFLQYNITEYKGKNVEIDKVIEDLSKEDKIRIRFSRYQMLFLKKKILLLLKGKFPWIVEPYRNIKRKIRGKQ